MKLKVFKRDVFGKTVKNLRKDGLVPAIVYGKNLKESLPVSFKKLDFLKLYREVWTSTAFDIEWDWIKEFVLIQDYSLDPVTDVLIHVDFLIVSKDEKVQVEVPLVFEWESIVEKEWSWKIEFLRDFVLIQAYPQDLPSNIKIDISSIKTSNDVLFVKDIKVDSKLEVTDDLEQPIITVVSIKEEKVEEEVVEDSEEEITEGDSESESKD